VQGQWRGVSAGLPPASCTWQVQPHGRNAGSEQLSLCAATRRWQSGASTPRLPTVYGYDVSKVSVYQGRFIVGRTHATLLLVCACAVHALHYHSWLRAAAAAAPAGSNVQHARQFPAQSYMLACWATAALRYMPQIEEHVSLLCRRLKLTGRPRELPPERGAVGGRRRRGALLL
jgi:hypothetical protein